VSSCVSAITQTPASGPVEKFDVEKKDSPVELVNYLVSPDPLKSFQRPPRLAVGNCFTRGPIPCRQTR